MLSDHGHPRFRKLNSTVPVDVVRIWSLFNVNSLSTRVQVRVWVNKLNLVQDHSEVCVLCLLCNKHSITSISISIWSLSAPTVSFPLLVVALNLLVPIYRMMELSIPQWWTVPWYVFHINRSHVHSLVSLGFKVPSPETSESAKQEVIKSPTCDKLD